MSHECPSTEELLTLIMFLEEAHCITWSHALVKHQCYTRIKGYTKLMTRGWTVWQFDINHSAPCSHHCPTKVQLQRIGHLNGWMDRPDRVSFDSKSHLIHRGILYPISFRCLFSISRCGRWCWCARKCLIQDGGPLRGARERRLLGSYI